MALLWLPVRVFNKELNRPARVCLPAPIAYHALASLVFIWVFDYTTVISTSKPPSVQIRAGCFPCCGPHVKYHLLKQAFPNCSISNSSDIQASKSCPQPQTLNATGLPKDVTPPPPIHSIDPQIHRNPDAGLLRIILYSLNRVLTGLPTNYPTATQQTLTFILVIKLSISFGEPGHPHSQPLQSEWK